MIKYSYLKEALILNGVLNRPVVENGYLIASNATKTKNHMSIKANYF